MTAYLVCRECGRGEFYLHVERDDTLSVECVYCDIVTTTMPEWSLDHNTGTGVREAHDPITITGHRHR